MKISGTNFLFPPSSPCGINDAGFVKIYVKETPLSLFNVGVLVEKKRGLLAE